ncbi:unnamed protein product [Sphenostylis stenocarpa]|uniref:TIR domain-containing protein n=1 Tax=Sphenostylis stenocarpa TaxID=92480 RepID=A0AA86VMR3_9FABA|nr:unnamed protein product [Sphenostylis stenocarpa]
MPSASSSSKSETQWIYDVFINFRGEDTRKNFVSHLYSALANAGVNSFLDDEKLPKGQELKTELFHAIEGSRISIVVFSENYIYSTWCLDELVKIMECHASRGQVVLPVFYFISHWSLSDLRDVSFEVIFDQAGDIHREKQWQNALSNAAHLSGWDVLNYSLAERFAMNTMAERHRSPIVNENTVVKEIVSEVMEILDRTFMSITDFPVGLESRVQHCIGFLRKQTREAYILGIWGMGGIGKTTIAKAIYNELRHEFKYILKTEKIKVYSIDWGKAMIKERLCTKKDRGYVTEILNGCGLHADIGITVLLERSLIKVEKNNKLGIHDLLRDMGREIVRQSSPLEPQKRSRLWVHDDVVDILTEQTGTGVIEGLALKMQRTSRVCFGTEAFEKMKRLRLLQLDHVQLAGDFGNLPKQLRWVYWKAFSLTYIPDNFYQENVVSIDIKYSYLKQVWKEPQLLERLKFLNLSHSKHLSKTPDFSKLPNLEKLILKDCPSLYEVHHSIGDLSNLLLLNLKDCTCLGNLPIIIYKLKSLQTLILSGCSKIDKLEEDIVQMESLTTLIADNTGLKQVPFSIVRSKRIGYVSLCGYEGLARDVFPSLIWSWMSHTGGLSACTQPFGIIPTSIVSMDLQDSNLVNLLSNLREFSKLRSICVQCESDFLITQELRMILDELCNVNFSESENAYLSQISEMSMVSHLIGMGSYHQVFDMLSNSISEVLSLFF